MSEDLKPYFTYKNSGVPWLGPVPEHWETRRLKSLLGAPITDGPHVTPTFVSDGMPFLSVDGIQNGNLVFEKCRYVSPEDHVEFRKKTAPRRDDILLVKAASTGKIARVQVDFEFSIWSPLALIRPDHFQVLSPFLEYALKDFSSQAQIETLCTLNTQKNISMNDIPKVLLPLPPITEQEAIVRYLDHADRKVRHAIRARQQLIKLLTEQKQAIIQRTVTRGLDPNVRLKPSGVPWLGDIPENWEPRRLKDWCDINERALPETTDVDFTFQYVDIASVETGRLVRQPQRMRFGTAPSRARHILRQGDTIVSTVRTYLKAVWFASDDVQDWIASTGFAVFTPRSDTEPKYVSDFLQSNAFTDCVVMESVGIAYPAIAYERLASIVVAVPPLVEQTAIVKFLDAATANLDKAIDAARCEIDLLREYRTRLIADVVTGKLDVRNVPVPVDKTDVMPEELVSIADVEATDESDDVAETDPGSEENA